MAKTWGAEGARVSEEQGFAPYLAMASVAHEWAVAVRGGDAAAVERLRTAANNWLGMGYGVAVGAWQVLHAEALLVHGKAEEARAVAAGAIERIRKNGEYVFDGWVLNVRGDALLALNDEAAAKSAYEEVMETANRLGLFGQALRAPAGLAKRARGDGDVDRAQPFLAGALEAVAPSDASPDCVRAKSFLESLDTA